MAKRLTSTRRQKRTLTIPAPVRRGNIKIPLEGWINCATVVLIEEGIGAVKVDRLAKRLSVTRGGFYYHFSSHHKLLEALLDTWRTQNHFTPDEVDTSSVTASLKALESISDNLVHERGFDPQFDMAIREWARISQPVADVVHKKDEARIGILRQIFNGLGYSPKEADIRARVYYWHQIGYYAIGVHQDLAQRENDLQTYLVVLGGERFVAAVNANQRKKPLRRTSGN